MMIPSLVPPVSPFQNEATTDKPILCLILAKRAHPVLLVTWIFTSKQKLSALQPDSFPIPRLIQ